MLTYQTVMSTCELIYVDMSDDNVFLWDDYVDLWDDYVEL